VVDHTEVDRNGFLIDGVDNESHPMDEPRSREALIPIRKFIADAKMAASSGPPFSSIRFGMRMVIFCNILSHLWTSPSMSRRKPSPECSLMS
jgi:hypothetical protein